MFKTLALILFVVGIALTLHQISVLNSLPPEFEPAARDLTSLRTLWYLIGGVAYMEIGLLGIFQKTKRI